MPRQISAVAILCVAVFVRDVPAASGEFIFLINTNDGRASSGFLLAESGGIVTCLHGIVGATTITAASSAGPILKEPIEVVKVDIARDLALLSSPEIRQIKGGLRMATNHAFSQLKNVRAQVIGYPAGLDVREYVKRLDIQDPPQRPLRHLLSDALMRDFAERRSPLISLEVLSLQGSLYPGHSGAALIIDNGDVIAVANGGLVFQEMQPGGRPVWKDTDISWAIPLNKVYWSDAKDPNVAAEMRRLAQYGLRLGHKGFALGDSKNTQLVLAEYTILEARGDTIITVLKNPPDMTTGLLWHYFLEGITPRWPTPEEKVLIKKHGLAWALNTIPEKLDEVFFIVPSGTQVERLPTDVPKPADSSASQIVDILPGGSHYKVKVLSGEHQGKEGWVPLHFLRKVQVVE